jgi:GTP-binding protein
MKDLFIDEARISVTGGDGGDGCTSFRREKYVPRGGPNGGDGGRGGNVILVAERGLRTLWDQRYRRVYTASRGTHGMGSGRHGRHGEDLVIRVPTGTLVYDAGLGEDAAPLADLVADGDRFVAASGGRGGRGNARFATSTRQTPHFSERGHPGQIRELRLSLKLLADVGLVGFPNAGKSTLLRRISAARPRVASYPFTTLTPSLGVVERGDERFVVADIPGLIEGASGGAGLGDRFLRHVERTEVLVHLLDAGAWLFEERDPVRDYEAIRRELACYDAELAKRTEIVVINKVDVVDEHERLEPIEAALRKRCGGVFRISGATGEGIPELLGEVARALREVSEARVAGGRA